MSGNVPNTIVVWPPRPVIELSESMFIFLERLVRGKPALAVPAFMVEQPNKRDNAGRLMDRVWLFDQWARIAAAGSAVRVVVVEYSVRGLQSGGVTYQNWVDALDACR